MISTGVFEVSLEVILSVFVSRVQMSVLETCETVLSRLISEVTKVSV